MFGARRAAQPSTALRPEEARAVLAARPWPPALLAALAKLREGGHQAWLVGGSVRDALLGRAASDTFDVATDLAPDAVTARFERVEPIGLAHGTVLVILPGLGIECTTFRREGAYTDARHPDRVEFTADLREDLARRDLTVNAMAFDPASGVLVDPYDGLGDLARRLLRAVGDPAARFHEDALRPLRVARFAATLGMTPEPATLAALGSARERAARVAQERVREEFCKMMGAPHPSDGLELLRAAGLLALWMPEVAACRGVPQNRHHAYDVYVHSLETCDAAPADKPRVRWAALLHDIGKPSTAALRDGDWTFYGHAEAGAKLAAGLLERLRFPAAERDAIVHLVREHMFEYRSEWSDAAIRRWLRRVGEDAVADLFDLRIADALGNGKRAGFPVALDGLRARIEAVLAAERVLRVTDLAVDGRDVMRVLGLPPGPGVGAALERLLEEVIEDPARNDREWLEARLVRWREERALPGLGA